MGWMPRVLLNKVNAKCFTQRSALPVDAIEASASPQRVDTKRDQPKELGRYHK